MLNIRRVTPPAFEPVGLDEMKTHSRIDHTDEDGYVLGLIVTAREYAENATWRTLMGTEWEYVLDAWPSDSVLQIPRPPLRGVISVKYVDDTGADQTFGAGNYVVDTTSEPGRIALKSGASWPTARLAPVGGVRIRFTAGYSDVLAGGASEGAVNAARLNVPAATKHAIKLIAAHLYENREQTISGTPITDLPFGISNLLMSDRAFEF